jgi:hypothetical protein
MTAKKKPLPGVGGAAGSLLRAVPRALDELQRFGMIEYWSRRRGVDGEWVINLKPTKAWEPRLPEAMIQTGWVPVEQDQGGVAS